MVSNFGGRQNVGEMRVFFARICLSSKLEHAQSDLETVMKSTTRIVIYCVINVESRTLIVLH